MITKYVDDERVRQARRNVHNAYASFTTSPMYERQEELNQKKRTIEDVYATSSFFFVDVDITLILKS